MRNHLNAICLGAALCAGLSAAATDTLVVEEIIAKVNGDIVTRSDIDKGRKAVEQELRQRNVTGAALEQAMKDRESDLLRDKIDQLLLVSKGKELNISVDGEIQKQLADIQLQYKIADPEKFQAFVREQTGMPYEDYKSDMKNALLTRRVIGQEVSSKISIPRAEVQKYYEENKAKYVREERVFLRELLVAADEKNPAAAEKKAKDLVTRARNGEKFPELARDNSAAATAAAGGEIGGARRGDLDPKIAALVFDKDRGTVTDPIRIPAGYLILKVEEIHKAGQASFEEVEQEVMEALYAPRMQPAIRTYLTRLREEAFLEIKEGYTDSSPAPGKSTAWTDPAQLRPETVSKEEVAAQTRRKRLLWMVPIPGTKTGGKKDDTSASPSASGTGTSASQALAPR